MDRSLPGSSVHGILQQEYWSELPSSPPGDLPYPGIELTSPKSPALAGGLFTTNAIWEGPLGIPGWNQIPNILVAHLLYHTKP